MKVAVFGVYPHSPHFETQLELMEDRLAAGDEVIYVSCDRALRHCDANPSNDQLFCRACVGKRKQGIRTLSKPVRVIQLSSLMAETDGAAVTAAFPDLATLERYELEGYDCGEAVASSLQSQARTVYPDFEAYGDFVERAMASTMTLYRAARRVLSSLKPDLAYIFNGRAASGRCFVRACQREGVRFYTHERGSTVDSYMLAENTIPHDVDYRQQEIRKHWDANPDLAAKEEVAARFFARMRKGKLAYRETNYLKHQVSGQVPSYWQEGRPRVVFFSSTETERAALKGFYKRRIYTSLVDMLTRIVTDLKRREFKGVFVLRMHPNSQDEYEKLMARFAEIDAGDFLHIIPPRESVDTYALLDSADKVLVATSTLGMEAAYAGVPSISLERSNYDLLGSTYSPASHGEVIDLILQPLEPKDRLGAVMYGYYTLTFGQKFKRIAMRGQNKCLFNGRRIRSPVWLDWAMKARKKLARR